MSNGISKVTVMNTVATAPSTLEAAESGTWDYVSGTGGGTVAITGRVVGTSFHANGADGTVTIDGGDTVTIRSGAVLNLNPRGLLEDPSFVMSATIDYLIEFVI